VFWLAAALWGMLPSFFQYALNLKILSGSVGGAAWLGAMVLLWVLYFSHSRLFPRFELVIRSDEQWAKKYSTEIATVVALVSLILSVLSLVLGK